MIFPISSKVGYVNRSLEGNFFPKSIGMIFLVLPQVSNPESSLVCWPTAEAMTAAGGFGSHPLKGDGFGAWGALHNRELLFMVQKSG